MPQCVFASVTTMKSMVDSHKCFDCFEAATSIVPPVQLKLIVPQVTTVSGLYDLPCLLVSSLGFFGRVAVVGTSGFVSFSLAVDCVVATVLVQQLFTDHGVSSSCC